MYMVISLSSIMFVCQDTCQVCSLATHLHHNQNTYLTFIKWQDKRAVINGTGINDVVLSYCVNHC